MDGRSFLAASALASFEVGGALKRVVTIRGTKFVGGTK
jgi:hypothetical protein